MPGATEVMSVGGFLCEYHIPVAALVISLKNTGVLCSFFIHIFVISLQYLNHSFVQLILSWFLYFGVFGAEGLQTFFVCMLHLFAVILAMKRTAATYNRNKNPPYCVDGFFYWSNGCCCIAHSALIKSMFALPIIILLTQGDDLYIKSNSASFHPFTSFFFSFALF